MSDDRPEDDDPFADIAWEDDDATQDPTTAQIANDPDDDIYGDGDEHDDINAGTSTAVVFDPSSLTSKRSLEGTDAATDAPPKKKTRIKPIKFQETSFTEALNRCEDSLSRRIEYLLQVLSWTCDRDLVDTAKRMLNDTPLMTSLAAPNGRTMTNILHLRNAVRNQARILPSRSMTEEEGRDGSTTEELRDQVLHHRRGSVVQWQQIFYALLRDVGIRVRWVTAIQALSLHPQDHLDLLAQAADDDDHLRQWQQRGKGSYVQTVDDTSSTKKEGYVCCWLEIWLPGLEACWIDIVEGLLSPATGHPALHTKRSSASPWHAPIFLVSVEDKRPVRTGYVLRDMTEIYWSKYSHLAKSSVVSSGRETQATKWLQESVLRCRSWFHSHVEALSAPSQRVTAAASRASVGAVTASSASAAAVVLIDPPLPPSMAPTSGPTLAPASTAGVKITVVHDDEVIDLLSSSSDEDEGGDGDERAQATRATAASAAAATAAKTADRPPTLITHRRGDHDDDDGDDHDDNNGDDDDVEEQERLLQHFALQRQRQLQEQALPTSLAQFKNHPYYCLARDLLSDECLHPEKRNVVAVVRGESVYLRSAVEALHTYDGWRRRLRIVRPEARDQPVKVIQRKIPSFLSKDNGTSSATSRSNPPPPPPRVKEVKYYGSWQTEALVIPPVEAATELIPRNDYGNLEVWDGQPQFVPAGATYIAEPFVEKAAKHLGVQFVPAVVGFETQYAGMTATRRPKFAGIVVLERDAPLVVDVAAQLHTLSEEKDAQQRMARMAARWERLVGVVLKRIALREKYGA